MGDSFFVRHACDKTKLVTYFFALLINFLDIKLLLLGSWSDAKLAARGIIESSPSCFLLVQHLTGGGGYLALKQQTVLLGLLADYPLGGLYFR